MEQTDQSYISFNKPYGVMSQFTDAHGRQTLKDFIDIPNVYAAGRLDYRSEGLLLLSDDGLFIHRLTDPNNNHPKTYLAQVEGSATLEDIQPLQNDIVLPGIQTKLAYTKIIPEPTLPPRSKPVREYHPTTWLKIILCEGKKHQVRRMTAAIGFPTLRLVRVSIANIELGELKPGEWRNLGHLELKKIKHTLGMN